MTDKDGPIEIFSALSVEVDKLMPMESSVDALVSSILVD